MFLPNIIKIACYNFELYHFKVGAFFIETQCTFCSRFVPECQLPPCNLGTRV